jgi:hypothetical protein
VPLVIDATTGPVGPLGVGVLANDSHVDEGQSLTLEVSAAPPAAVGTVELHNDGSFIFTPAPAFFGVATFRYRVFDGFSYSSEAFVDILVVESSTGLPGDFNHDNSVDLMDLLILKQHWGKAATADEGDLNGDGTVDRVDLAMFTERFGDRTPPAPSPAAAVDIVLAASERLSAEAGRGSPLSASRARGRRLADEASPVATGAAKDARRTARRAARLLPRESVGG